MKFIFSEDLKSFERYEDTLQRANITYDFVFKESLNIISTSTGVYEYEINLQQPSCMFEFVQAILDAQENKQVVIAKIRKWTFLINQALDQLIGSNIHVFIDDFQVVWYESGGSKIYEQSCQQLSQTNKVWITCDLTQKCFYGMAFVIKLGANCSFITGIPANNIASLSLNLRNTSDITGILIKIREQLIENIAAEETTNIDVILPRLQPGHRIHGPKTVVHVIDERVDSNDYSLLGHLVNMELDKLYDEEMPDGFSMTAGIVTNIYTGSHKRLNEIEFYESIVTERSNRSYNNINLEWCDIESCYSVEYSAAVAVHSEGFGGNRDDVSQIESLYLAISRAKVHCAVILYTTRYDTMSECRLIYTLLNKLQDCVRIEWHCSNQDSDLEFSSKLNDAIV